MSNVPEVLVAVMGCTGAGKSTFIQNELCQLDEQLPMVTELAHPLEISESSWEFSPRLVAPEIEISEPQTPTPNLHLIDTPGFKHSVPHKGGRHKEIAPAITISNSVFKRVVFPFMALAEPDLPNNIVTRSFIERLYRSTACPYWRCCPCGSALSSEYMRSLTFSAPLWNMKALFNGQYRRHGQPRHQKGRKESARLRTLNMNRMAIMSNHRYSEAKLQMVFQVRHRARWRISAGTLPVHSLHKA